MHHPFSFQYEMWEDDESWLWLSYMEPKFGNFNNNMKIRKKIKYNMKIYLMHYQIKLLDFINRI